MEASSRDLRRSYVRTRQNIGRPFNRMLVENAVDHFDPANGRRSGRFTTIAIPCGP